MDRLSSGKVFKYLILLLTISSTCVFSEDKDDKFFLKSDVPSRHILGITSGFGYVAVATLTRIIFVSNNEERNIAGQIEIPFKPRTKFLELKMFSKSEIFYCDENGCGLCTYSGTKSSCSEYHLPADEPQLLEIKTASVVRINGSEQLMLGLTYLDQEESTRIKMIIMRFDAQDNGVLEPKSHAQEPEFMENPKIVNGFEESGFIFYVVSATQIFKPEAILHKNANTITSTKVMRICAADLTFDLASKIAVHVGCDGENKNLDSLAEAATYDEKTKNLEIVSFNNQKMTHSICKFKMTNLDKRFNKTWNVCQKVTYTEIKKKEHICRYPPLFEEMSKKEGCLIYTWRDEEEEPFCTRFGPDKIMENCNLADVESETYRNGWLEDFEVLQGELMMKFPPYVNIANVTGLVPNGKAYFASTITKDFNTEIIRMSPSISSEIKLNWKKQATTPSKFGFAVLSSTTLLFLSSKGVQMIPITCNYLYSECHDLQNGGWEDPLNCAICAEALNYRTIANNEIGSCSNPIKGFCPPVVNFVERFINKSGVHIHGFKFSELENPHVMTCDTSCVVKNHNDATIECETNSKETIDADCEDLQIIGEVNSTKYTFPYKWRRVSAGVQTETEGISSSSESKGSMPSWKIAVTVLSIIFIILVLAIIVNYMRRRFPHIEGHNRPINRSVQNDYDMDHINRFPQFATMNGDGYVSEFRDLPLNLKIDFTHLKIDMMTKVGQGHFGVVFPALYQPPNEMPQDVVCKYMKEGRISEFYDEAKIMSNFNHPNVLKLVGVSLDNISHCPIIITKHMMNGDLKSYIANRSNFILMRQMFHFAIDIANGMAYIHSKGYIHRDLAARNCTLDEHLRLQIADFGLCRKLDEETDVYSRNTLRDLPVLWYPPEILESPFAKSSDVWSFGVVLWELFTRGNMPYERQNRDMILAWLQESEANRLPRPLHCPEKLYVDAMLTSWRADPNERPTFEELIQIIQNVVVYIEEYDRTQLQSGYERVSHSSLTPSPQNQPFRRTISSHSSSSRRHQPEMEPLLESSPHIYRNVFADLEEAQQIRTTGFRSSAV